MGILTSKDMWNPNTYYYAKDRYKHMIEYEGNLYVCTTTHISGNAFDGSKFASLSGGGGGGLSGTWDMTNSTTPIVFDDFLGAELSGPYTITPDETSPIIAASTISPTSLNSAVIFENLYNTSTFDPYLIYFGYVNVEATLADIVAGFNSQPAPSLTFACFGTIFSDNTISYINGMTLQTGDITDGLAHPSGQSISFKLIQTGNEYGLYAKVSSDSTYRHLTSDGTINALNGVKPVLVGLYLGGFTTPITVIDFGSTIVDPIPPSSPIGKRYLVNGAGTYKNQTASVGNIVEFIDINDIFIEEDIEDINDGISAIAMSLQQEIAAVPVTRGVLTNTTIHADINNIYSFINTSDITTEMVTLEYSEIPSEYINFFNLNIRRELADNSSILINVKFPDVDGSYNPGQFKFTIQSGTNGGFDSPYYKFDIRNISSMLFRCTNGMIEYLGYVNTGYLPEFDSSLPDNGHTISVDIDTSSTNVSPIIYSDVKHVIINNITSNLVSNITVSMTPVEINMKNLPQINSKGIRITIAPGSGTFSHITINSNKILFSITPAAAGTYYDYIYYPEHDILIADATNP